MRNAFAHTLAQLAKQVPNVFLVVSDISPAGSIAEFREEFPDRFYNVGVAESTMISICAGLALRGCKPFAYTIATFALYRPFEQVRSELCYQNLPVTLVGIGAGVSYSTLGSTHHAQEDVALLSALPNMTILAPCDPAETEAATWACAHHPGPIYLRLGKAGEPDLTSEAVEPFEFGRARLLRHGADICIISYGPIMKLAFELATTVEQEHHRSVAVVSAHTLKPLDVERIADMLDRFETVVVLEEHSVRGGLGAQVKQIAWERSAHCRLHAFGLKDEFIYEFGSAADLWEGHGLSTSGILGHLFGI